MAELKNTFSWSFSAAGDFEECRRKRYWSKYGMWGGWDARASEIQRTAYRLNKMENRFSLQGNAVERAIMWVLREKQAGRTVTGKEAYEKVARPYLNKAWKESIDRQWEKDPKRHCCLHEHYYAEAGKEKNKEWTAGVIERTRRCIENFIERVLPRLEGITAAHEIPVATPDQGGDPESFEFEGIKVYAIPDYVYQRDGRWHIHDWKSGRAKDAHRMQVALYGLWANVKHGVAPEDITIYLEYLSEGVVAYEQVGASLLEAAEQHIRASAEDMADYLVDADRGRNEAAPKEEWELAADFASCRRCRFFELCKPELEEAQAT